MVVMMVTMLMKIRCDGIDIEVGIDGDDDGGDDDNANGGAEM